MILLLSGVTACTPGSRAESMIPASTLLANPTTPTPAGTPTRAAPTITPSPHPTRPAPEQVSRTYTIQYGDTLLGIATAFGATVEELMQANGLTNANQIAIGQVLDIPMKVTIIGPGTVLLPDSELVYSPAYRHFNVTAVVAEHPGWLKDYTETLVDGRTLTGAELIQTVAQEYSVGPRVLLTLLELHSAALTQPQPTTEIQTYPLGFARDGWEGLAAQLLWTADALNAGFYDWLDEHSWTFRLENGAYVQYAPTINAGTAGVQRALATSGDLAALEARVQTFTQIYQRLWGDPFAYAVEPLVPPDLAAPALELPWSRGETWYLTGGPHGAWGEGSALGALDFVTAEKNLGCTTSQRWATAAAPGLVVMSKEGFVLQDLDNDGFIGTGWVLLYMHVATEGRATAGTRLATGDPVGHPSCEGGVSNASHLHFTRRYNGVWIAAEHPQYPLVLSGWIANNGHRPYDGTLSKDTAIKEALEDWQAGNAIQH